jgi:two-component system response regulator
MREILLVEDNPDDVELTIRAFKKTNILNDIAVVTDGEQALDYIFGRGKFAGKDPDDHPGLILLDLKLPKIDGLQVLQEIRADERTKYIPVVILTSSKEEQDLMEGYRLGANSYVRKPIKFEDFITAVTQLGMYWLVLNEPVPTFK